MKRVSALAVAAILLAGVGSACSYHGRCDHGSYSDDCHGGVGTDTGHDGYDNPSVDH